jgi:dTDP-glucose pyrophosphorylase
MNVTLVVLAAGMGSRYGGLKQMDPIGPHGETVLDYSVYDAWRAGFTKVVFVIRQDFAEKFQQQVGRPLAGKLEVAYAHQEINELPNGRQAPPGRTKPWGTAHAIWTARREVNEPFCVINADDFYGRGAFRALKGFFDAADGGSREPLPCSLVAYRLKNTLSEHGGVSRGVLQVAPDGFLQGVEEQTDIQNENGQPVARTAAGSQLLDPETLVSMNCWGFQPDILRHFEDRIERFLACSGTEQKREVYVADPVESAIAEGKATFQVLTNEENWFGVTYQEDKAAAVAAIGSLIHKGAYPERLWS